MGRLEGSQDIVHGFGNLTVFAEKKGGKVGVDRKKTDG